MFSAHYESYRRGNGKEVKKILVTGSNGFIGSKLIDRLVDRKDCIVSLYGLPTNDILNTERLEIAFKAHKPDTVLHLAAQTRLRHSLDNVQEDAMANIIGSINVFEMAAKCGTRNIIYTSTGGARYGYSGYFDESDVPKPESPYGISKRVAEEYLSYYGKKYKINSISLCLGNVYGPGDRLKNGRVIPKILDAIKKDKEFTVFGDGSTSRDYVYIDDVVDLLERLSFDGFVAKNHIYNISNEHYTLNAVIRFIEAHTNKRVKIKKSDFIEGEANRVSLNTAMAEADLNWNPKVTLSEGIKRTVKSYGF